MSISFLFNGAYEYLGEIVTTHGRFERATLTDRGEVQVGPRVEAWRSAGIPVRRALRMAERAGTSGTVSSTERISQSDPAFRDALKRWAHDQGFMVITVPLEQAETWEVLSHLPIEPVERFALLLAFRHANQKERSEWKSFLREARSICDVETERAERSVAALRKKAATDFVKQFQS